MEHYIGAHLLILLFDHGDVQQLRRVAKGPERIISQWRERSEYSPLV